MNLDSLRTRQVGDLVIRERVPEGEGPHPVMLLLHGWTGDENVMWVFTPRLDERYWIVAPRGLYAAGREGYGWQPHRQGSWPSSDDFRPAIEAVLGLLSKDNFPGADLGRVNAMGFSQGAALAYSLALLHPGRLNTLAGLSGFLPEDAEALAVGKPLAGKPVFIAHGTQDDQVPVERARQAVDVLESAGALVTYCEEEVGHKLSAPCFRGMEKFFEAHFLQI